MKIDKETICQRALELTASDGRHVGTQLASEFGVSRQVANGYLQALVRDGFLEADGSTKGRTYGLKTLAETERTYPREGLEEDVVWREAVAPQLADLPDTVRDIWRYGVTEMVNNAIDHSGSAEVRVALMRNALFTDVSVADEGEGIFLKIQRARPARSAAGYSRARQGQADDGSPEPFGRRHLLHLARDGCVRDCIGPPALPAPGARA